MNKRTFLITFQKNLLSHQTRPVTHKSGDEPAAAISAKIRKTHLEDERG